MSTGWLVGRTLRDPLTTAMFDVRDWLNLIAAARSLSLIGSVAERLRGLDLPENVARILDDVRGSSALIRRQALWEAECARMALAQYNGKVVLMKGTAYVAAGMQAGIGRSIGDLDIMVDHTDLDEVEAMILQAGWEWVKPDPYDDHYYRTWMHELPPLIHRSRDRMIDVHHTTLPLTARQTPDAKAMLADAVRLENGLYVMGDTDMLCHAVAHLLADGDLAGGMRNLWDVHCLVGEFAERGEAFWPELRERAALHGLSRHVARALRLAHALYGTEIDRSLAGRPRWADRLYLRRVTAVNGWGQKTRPFLRQAFYIRSHYLRMPPLMLMRHLWTKWRKKH